MAISAKNTMCYKAFQSSAILFALSILFAWCIFLGNGSIVEAESPLPNEYLIKAAFLYNFAKFVDWPHEKFEEPSSPINLYILGEDPFGLAIDYIVGKTAQGRSFLIKRVSRDEDLGKCHILYISASEEKFLPKILDSLRGSSVLTVGDVGSFARNGGIINLIRVQDKIRFEINVDAAHRAGLRISAPLLQQAKIIRDNGQEERH